MAEKISKFSPAYRKLSGVVLRLLLCLGTGLFAGSAFSATATLLPSGAGSSTQWTATGAGTNWACVTANDGDTSYVFATAKGLKDSYAMEDMAAAGGIAYVRAYVYAKKNKVPAADLNFGINSGGREVLVDGESGIRVE